MRRSDYAFAILGVLALGVAGYGWREMARAREAARTAENGVFKAAGMDAEMKQLDKQLMSIERDRDRLRAALNSAMQTPPAAAPPPASPAIPSKKGNALAGRPLTELLREDPALRALFVAGQRTALMVKYAPLAQTLGLSPAQADQFIELCLRREEQRLDVEELNRSADSVEQAAGTTLRAEDEAAFKSAQLQLLGEKGYQQFVEFERLQPVRTVVTQLAAAAALADLALTVQQGDQLVRAMASASASYQAGGDADHRQLDWTALDNEARRILSPEQFTLFTKVEPLGGGPSRFEAKLRKEILAATQKDRTAIPLLR